MVFCGAVRKKSRKRRLYKYVFRDTIYAMVPNRAQNGLRVKANGAKNIYERKES